MMKIMNHPDKEWGNTSGVLNMIKPLVDESRVNTTEKTQKKVKLRLMDIHRRADKENEGELT
jgi:hypothetical protein